MSVNIKIHWVNEINLYQLINKEREWAVNIIEKLEAENKALKSSRDELLKVLKLAKTLSERDGLPGQFFMKTAIKKAEELEEKETK